MQSSPWSRRLLVVAAALEACSSSKRPGADQPDSGSSPAYYRPFAETSPWNTPIGAAPAIDPDSPALITDLQTIPNPNVPPGHYFTSLEINIQAYSIPLYFVDASTPRVPVTTKTIANGLFHTSDVPAQAMVPIPAGAQPASGSDAHLCLVDKDAHTEWDLYGASPTPSWTCVVGASMDTSGSGVRPTDGPGIDWWERHGARACGFPLVAGLITVDDIKSGHIRHALAWAYPHIRSQWFRSPASTAQGDDPQLGALPTRGIPCGGQLQLDPTLDLDTLGLTPAARLIARALQEYGAYVSDASGGLTFYADAAPDAQAYWSGALKSADIAAIPLGKLRVLALGPLTRFQSRRAAAE